MSERHCVPKPRGIYMVISHISGYFFDLPVIASGSNSFLVSSGVPLLLEKDIGAPLLVETDTWASGMPHNGCFPLRMPGHHPKRRHPLKKGLGFRVQACNFCVWEPILNPKA